MMKTISLAALLIASATASFAGSLGTSEEDTKIAAPLMNGVKGTGIGLPLVFGGVVAAGTIIALVSNDDDSDSVVSHPDAD